MKTINSLFKVAGVIFIILILQSCLDGDTYNDNLYPNALVTVKPVSDKSFYLQLDDSTTLFPVNIKSSPFGTKEVRALANFEEVEEASNGYTKAISINWIDSLRTKQMVPDLGSKNDSVYGTDPVEIVNDWVTIAEDGYLTLRFRTVCGDLSKTHFVNLIANVNPDNPYEVEFRHNAYDNVYGTIGDGLIAFRLNMLPDTKGKTVKLKLKWKSFSGDKSVEFNYCTRVASGNRSAITDVRSVLNLK